MGRSGSDERANGESRGSRELRPPPMLQSCRQGVRSCVSRGATGPSRLSRRWVASTADDDAGADPGDDLQPEALALGPSVDAYASYGRWFKLDRKSAGLPGGPTAAPKQAPVQRKHASRQLLSNPQTADKIVRAWGLHKSKPLTIVEINAGVCLAASVPAENRRQRCPYAIAARPGSPRARARGSQGSESRGPARGARASSDSF